MVLHTHIGRNLLPVGIILITGLLILNIVLTLLNNRIITDNNNLQKETERVETTITQFAIVIIHNLDLGLRGFALFKKDKYLNPMRFAMRDKDSIMTVVEKTLIRQKYTPLTEFYQLRDSINAYAELCVKMLGLLENNDTAEFLRLSNLDKGYLLWLQYEQFSRNVSAFERVAHEKASKRYLSALRNNYLIQILLLLFTVPILLFTSMHTYRKYAVEVRLKEAEQEKATLLSSQNKRLETLVAERTQEILTTNIELQKQNEEIASQNDELNRHREKLAQQNKYLMRSKKQQLELYTQNLKEKSELTSRLSNELDDLKMKYTFDQQEQKFSDILHFNIVTEDDWERFRKTFQEVYPQFFGTLRYHFPSITASELRLSALTKMSLSLKETANMLGISPDSVKKSRNRLKKRLDLTKEESLEEYLQNIN